MKVDGDTECGDTVKLATLCYIRRPGQTLMLFRNKKENDYHEGKWNGLGGKFEPGESPEECMRREVHEESGLTVESATLKGIITFPLFDGKDDWYAFLYVIDGYSGALRESPEGELHWIDNDKLTTLNLWPGDRVFMAWLEHPEFFSAKFVYDNGTFVRHEVTFY